MPEGARFQHILGIRFFVGEAVEAIELISKGGGLLVVPAGPAMRNLAGDPVYREALLESDLAIADSAFMVLLWNMLYRPRISKLSGLRYLRALLQRDGFRSANDTLWVMPSEASVERTLAWLTENGVRADTCM
jgi:N-acetylglucosaminyldiphosphoundecaprenol N-acetyl-beta-D-mannosaminyltransferase